MKTVQLYFIALALGAFLLTSCSDTDEKTPVSEGDADFSTYVALGNSLTAGYADNALYHDGQKVSFPNLLAEQMEDVGGGEFTQPMVEDPQSVGIGTDKNARMVLDIVDGDLAPVPAAEEGDLSIFEPGNAGEGPFNNMGVPGAQLIHAVAPGYGNPDHGEGNYNPFFTRMASDPATASMVQDAAEQQPTFFSVFLGNNDVLGYATQGGVDSEITPMEGSVGVGFSETYDAVIETIMADGNAKGVVANIPDVTSTPFFTTILYNALELDEEQADLLNAGLQAEIPEPVYQQLIENGVLSEFEEGANGFLIEDEDSPVGFRQIQEGELVLLTAQESIQNEGWGSQEPLPDEFILTADELEKINTATEEFNQKIKSVAEEQGLAFVDVNAFLEKIKNGEVSANGKEITAEFVSGGAFSLDGIHLTPIGNVLLANEFIDAINATYDSFIPHVDPSGYGDVRYP